MRRVKISRGEIFNTFSNDFNINAKDGQEEDEARAPGTNEQYVMAEEEAELIQNWVRISIKEKQKSHLEIMSHDKPTMKGHMYEVDAHKDRPQPLFDTGLENTDLKFAFPTSSEKKFRLDL